MQQQVKLAIFFMQCFNIEVVTCNLQSKQIFLSERLVEKTRFQKSYCVYNTTYYIGEVFNFFKV